MLASPQRYAGKVLVTGADEFVGSLLVEKLVRDGHSIWAFVQYKPFNSWGWLDFCSSEVKGKFEVFAGDIRDPYDVKQSMSGCSSVAHLAALITILYSCNSLATYVDTNVKGTLNVLQAIHDLNVTSVTHSSTSELYGTAQCVPITEQYPFQGLSLYSATKLAVDQLSCSFYASDLSKYVTGQKIHVDGGWSSW
jgi:dTDP-glucose 4,6-dehydratase